MADFTPEFIQAFNICMKYEVGAFWKSDDKEVIDGCCATKEQKRKTGYVNDPADTGGETKFGVAKTANPTVDIKALTLNGAMQIYFKQYWLAGHCDILPFPLNVLHFDGCTNHGLSRACKYLQQSAGIPVASADGVIGPKSVLILKEQKADSMCQKVCDLREQFYKNIVANKPSQGKFLNGWLRRINEMRDFVTKHKG